MDRHVKEMYLSWKMDDFSLRCTCLPFSIRKYNFFTCPLIAVISRSKYLFRKHVFIFADYDMNGLDHDCGDRMSPQKESLEGFGGMRYGEELIPW